MQGKLAGRMALRELGPWRPVNEEFLCTGSRTESVHIFLIYSVERRAGYAKSQLLNRILAYQRPMETTQAMTPKMAKFWLNFALGAFLVHFGWQAGLNNRLIDVWTVCCGLRCLLWYSTHSCRGR